MPFLGAFAKLRKATISFVTSVCPPIRPSFCPHGTARLPRNGFSWSFTFGYISLESDKNNGHFTRIPLYNYDNISLNSFLEWEMFQTKVVEKIKTRTLCSIIFFPKSLSFTNRCTLYQPYKSLKFTLKLILKLLLHVSVYDHHQGAYTWV